MLTHRCGDSDTLCQTDTNKHDVIGSMFPSDVAQIGVYRTAMA
jgi:hypothetical protein